MSTISKLILFQRTQLDSDTILYKLFDNKVFRRIPFFFNIGFGLRSFANNKLIQQRYLQNMKEDFENIKDYLPSIKNPTIIDIGAGMAGNEIFINEHYKGQLQLLLVDKDQVDENIHFGYASEGSFYSANKLVKTFLEKHKIYPVQLNPEEFFSSDVRADIVISLYSWGFHYPISTYLAKVSEILKPGGVLIIDIRKIPDWKNMLPGFNIINIAKQDEKFARVIAKKNN